MAHTPAPQFIIIGRRIINAHEVLHVREGEAYMASRKTDVDGIQIEFIRQGSIFVEGITLEGAQAALNGAPF